MEVGLLFELQKFSRKKFLMYRHLKKILKKIFNFYSNIVINIFDNFVPLHDMRYGYLIEKNRIFDELLIKEFKKNILSKLKSTDSKVCNFELTQEFQLRFLKKLLPRIISNVKGYLGRSAKLDYIFVYCLNIMEDDSRNFSGVPHHDSVGRRLKVFIPLSDGVCEVNTFYVKKNYTFFI